MSFLICSNKDNDIIFLHHPIVCSSDVSQHSSGRQCSLIGMRYVILVSSQGVIWNMFLGDETTYLKRTGASTSLKLIASLSYLCCKKFLFYS